MTDRREFLRLAAAVAAALPFGRLRAAAAPPAKLDLLVVGATLVGVRVAEAARARGHAVTVVNPVTRGETLKLRDEHAADFELAQGRRLNSVILADATVPTDVRRLVRLLGAQSDHYVLLSNTMVYAQLEKPGSDESAPLHRATDTGAVRATDQTAAGLLVLCEQAAQEMLPGRVCVLRSGLVVGPGDSTGRFAYWPTRIARGGEVLAPGKPTDFTQFIDVRDLAAFIVHCAEQRTLGIFNADGPPTTMGALLDLCKKLTKSDARFVWVDADFLASHHVSAYREVPLWVPAGGAFAGVGQISSAKAVAAGLHYRPLAQTVADTLAWARTDPAAAAVSRRAGLTPEHEAQLLKAWRTRDEKPQEKKPIRREYRPGLRNEQDKHGGGTPPPGSGHAR